MKIIIKYGEVNLYLRLKKNKNNLSNLGLSLNLQKIKKQKNKANYFIILQLKF